MYKNYISEFKKDYGTLVRIYGEYNVFYDFVKMCAIAIYNSFAKNKEMEQEYLRIINAYEKKEQQLFPKMFGNLVMAYEKARDIIDILGPFYEKESLGNNHLGQFFTPTHVSDLMAKVIFNNKEELEKIIREKGFITLSEPTCGAGRYGTFSY